MAKRPLLVPSTSVGESQPHHHTQNNMENKITNKIEELKKEGNILQLLYDEGMIDFSGDEDSLEGLTLHAHFTGKLLIDVFKMGVEQAQKIISENYIEKQKVLDGFIQGVYRLIQRTDEENGFEENPVTKHRGILVSTLIGRVPELEEELKSAITEGK